ncbi:MAG: sialidase family protein [Acidimicrobiales bacterium]
MKTVPSGRSTTPGRAAPGRSARARRSWRLAGVVAAAIAMVGASSAGSLALAAQPASAPAAASTAPALATLNDHGGGGGKAPGQGGDSNGNGGDHGGSGGDASGGKGGKPAGAPLAFGNEVMVDNQRVTGEPSLSVSPTIGASGHHTVYVSTPYGFLTTASFIWRSSDGGNSFHLVPGQQPPLGKPDTCVGGGDSNVINDTAGNLYFTDLQGLTGISNAVSTNGGRTFSSTCNSNNGTLVDRPWISSYGNPLTTGREYMTVDNVAQCTPLNCSLGQSGSNMVEVTSTGGSLAKSQVFKPFPGQPIEPDGIVGGTVVNQKTGTLYISHSGYTNASGQIRGGSDSNGNDNAVIVDRFPGGFNQTTATPVPQGSISLCKPYNATGPCYSDTAAHAPRVVYQGSKYSSVTVGQDFTPIAIDRSGNLYVVWAQAPTNPATGQVDGPSTIYMATSTDHGATWSPPIDVSASVPGLRTNVFPWLAAGAAGRVDIVWYGTPTLGACSSSTGCGSSSIQGTWNVYMAQTLNAVTGSGKPNAHPSFQTTKVTQYPNHYGAICTMGIGCSTGGDRGLLDFIQVQAAPNGAADVVWSDSANTNGVGGTSSALIGFARQVSGPSLYGGMVSGPAPATGSAKGSPAAHYSANGTQVQAPASLRILSSSVTGPNYAHNYIVTMKVASLGALPGPLTSATLGGTQALWLTRWELPTQHPSFAKQGHIFYAEMRTNPAGAPTFYAGTTSSLGAPGANQGFFLTYPSSGPGVYQVQGSYTAGSPGTIRIAVPAADVGNPSGASLPLYSATGITATQAVPNTGGNGIFNQIDATAPYDVTYAHTTHPGG